MSDRNANARTTLDILRRRRARRRRPAVHLQLTAMIDVVFNLLIFLLVGSALKPAEGQIANRLPSMSPASYAMQIPFEPITIELVASRQPVGDDDDTLGCTISVVGHDVRAESVDQLYEYLQSLISQQAWSRSNPCMLVAGQDVSWQDVVDVHNACLRAGFEKVGYSQAADDARQPAVPGAVR